MQKKPSSQVLAENLERLMALHPDLSSNNALGKRAGIAHSHIGRIKAQESQATVDMLDRIARAFGIHPFELLTDGEEVRSAALARAMWGQPEVFQPKQDAPAKEVAHSRRKKGQRNEGDPLQ